MSGLLHSVEGTIARFIGGDERDWWEKAGIDPNVTARSLWLQSHS
jgi:hypothetical protein